MMRTLWSLMLALLLATGLSGCGYNTLPAQDEVVRPTGKAVSLRE